MNVAPWSQIQLYIKGLLETLQIDQWPYAVSVVPSLRFTLGHCAKVQGSSFLSLLFFFSQKYSEAGFRITEIYCGNLGQMKVWMNLTFNFYWFWRERSELFFLREQMCSQRTLSVKCANSRGCGLKFLIWKGTVTQTGKEGVQIVKLVTVFHLCWRYSNTKFLRQKCYEIKN